MLNDEQDIFGYNFISVKLIENKLISRIPNYTSGNVCDNLLTYRIRIRNLNRNNDMNSILQMSAFYGIYYGISEFEKIYYLYVTARATK